MISNDIRAVRWEDDALLLIDQRKLPLVAELFECKTHSDVIFAVKDMVVRGAPAIGVAAAYGIALGARYLYEKNIDPTEFEATLTDICDAIYSARPTAVNLMWAVDRQKRVIERYFHSTAQLSSNSEITRNPHRIYDVLLKEAHAILNDDILTNKKMADYGNEIIPQKATVLTHCNTGSLATAGWGTALGVIKTAHASGKELFVYADETRPRLQGAKLTSYELQNEGINSSLIVDSAAATLMRDGKIDAVLVGADRIAKNGDTANKIGTFMLSVVAKVYNVPFYAVAPTSTIDFDIDDGSFIEIEERDKCEITRLNDVQIVSDEIDCYNPAFDVTPAENISGIITEKGILRPPFSQSILQLKTDKKN